MNIGEMEFRNINPDEAMGLSFSCNTKIPPSLRNMYKELGTDLGIDCSSKTGDLSSWVNQGVLLLNSTELPDRKITNILGLVQGHTVYAIWLGKDLSALVRLILGGELTEYTEMMGKARIAAADRMIAQAVEMGADAVVNVRYMTTSVVGSAAELLVYGTAVKLGD